MHCAFTPGVCARTVTASVISSVCFPGLQPGGNAHVHTHGEKRQAVKRKAGFTDGQQKRRGGALLGSFLAFLVEKTPSIEMQLEKQESFTGTERDPSSQLERRRSEVCRTCGSLSREETKLATAGALLGPDD